MLRHLLALWLMLIISIGSYQFLDSFQLHYSMGHDQLVERPWFVHRRIWWNLIFAKQAWLWTSLAWFLLGLQQFPFQWRTLIRYILVTVCWYWTCQMGGLVWLAKRLEWGYCWPTEVNGNVIVSSHAHSCPPFHHWKVADISGHTFILSLAYLSLAREWSAAWPIRWRFVSFIIQIWLALTLILLALTLMYYHTLMEKGVALVWAFLCWMVTFI